MYVTGYEKMGTEAAGQVSAAAAAGAGAIIATSAAVAAAHIMKILRVSPTYFHE